MNPAKYECGQRVEQSTPYDRAGVKPYDKGTIVEAKADLLGPGTYVVDWDSGFRTKISGYHIRTAAAEPRTYCVGAPLVVQVHPDGSVTFEVDLSEVDLSEDESALASEADQRIVNDATERLGYYTHTTTRPTA